MLVQNPIGIIESNQMQTYRVSTLESQLLVQFKPIQTTNGSAIYFVDLDSLILLMNMTLVVIEKDIRKKLFKFNN